MIDPAWLDAPRRRFAWRTRCLACATSEHYVVGFLAPVVCATCRSTDRLITEHGPHPCAIEHCALFASDVNQLITAEADRSVVWHVRPRAWLAANVREVSDSGYAIDPRAISDDPSVVLAGPGLGW